MLSLVEFGKVVFIMLADLPACDGTVLPVLARLRPTWCMMSVTVIPGVVAPTSDKLYEVVGTENKNSGMVVKLIEG